MKSDKSVIFKVILLVTALMISVSIAVPVSALGSADPDLDGLIEEYQDQIKELVEGMDEDDLDAAFSFIKEKAANGALDSEEEILEAVEEGESRFDVQIENKYVEDMLEMADALEDMGFSSEKLIDHAESLYQEYGTDFVNHTQELVVETVKDSIGSIIMQAIGNFFRMLGEAIKSLFTELF